MTNTNSKKNQAKIIRTFRKVHRKIGALLFIFFFFIAVSGVILGWKNHSNGLITPESFEGTSTNLEHWLPLDSLHKKANFILHDAVSADLSLELDRIDVRSNKGIVKFVFKNHYWEIQLDGATGNLLNIGKRHSDFFENIHDGSILDRFFETSNGQIKVIYTTVMGLALFLFTVTGFWLWYGPKRMKRIKS